MIPREKITADYVRSILLYKKTTGELFWRKRPLADFKSKNSWSRWNNRYAGKLAGCEDGSGRIIIRIFKQTFFAHRLAFLIVEGRWPKEQIDHRDGDSLNNKWRNLRECYDFENKQNMKKMAHSRNTYPGVYRQVQRYKDKEYISYHARVRIKGVSHRKTGFKTELEAFYAYLEMKKQLHSFNPHVRGWR
jgi:hypothetical protein